MGMVWIAKNNTSYPELSGPIHSPVPTNEFVGKAGGNAGLQLLSCGSLIVETCLDQADLTLSPLLKCKLSGATSSLFSLSVDRRGTVQVRLQLDGAICSLDLEGDANLTQAPLRITFSWDVQNKSALLSVEAPQDGYLSQAEICTPLPMPIEIINALLAQKYPANVSSNVTFLSISNQIEPVGITPSIAGQSLIDTPIGQVPIQTLNRGDLVTTLDNGPQPIRWICERTVPTRGLFQPLMLRAPYFGLRQDTFVAPEQRLVFENTEIEYLFGVESVLVEARHLANNVNVIREPASTDSIHLYQLLFDDHEIITVSGCKMESLYIGQIANNPEILKSTLLAGMPAADVPRHKEIARPLLRSYEAMALQKGVFH